MHAGARADERAGVQAWKQWIGDSWATTPGVVYRWIKGSGNAALQMVKKPDDTYTANVEEMDSAIWAAWKPIKRLYESKPEPE